MDTELLFGRELWTGLALLLGSVMDVRVRRLPVWFLLAFGLGSVALILMADPADWQQKVIGVLLGGSLVLLGKWSGCIGMADGIVVMILGFLYGGTGCGKLVMTAVLFSAVVAVVLIALHRADAKTRLPFLPFLAAGHVVFLLQVLPG